MFDKKLPSKEVSPREKDEKETALHLSRLAEDSEVNLQVLDHHVLLAAHALAGLAAKADVLGMPYNPDLMAQRAVELADKTMNRIYKL